jgi:hypothetical protein
MFWIIEIETLFVFAVVFKSIFNLKNINLKILIFFYNFNILILKIKKII